MGKRTRPRGAPLDRDQARSGYGRRGTPKRAQRGLRARAECPVRRKRRADPAVLAFCGSCKARPALGILFEMAAV